MEKEWHCRYTIMHPGGSHVVTIPIFVKAKTAREASAEVLRLHPGAITVRVIGEYLETWQMPVSKYDIFR
jgi:hypothetical protein